MMRLANPVTPRATINEKIVPPLTKKKIQTENHHCVSFHATTTDHSLKQLL